MSEENNWYFTKVQLENTPSRKCGVTADQELSYRQQAANFIEILGTNVTSHLCINTAIVYLHRFYMFHSFTHFPWDSIATAALLLAAKVEEEPCNITLVVIKANHFIQDKTGQLPAYYVENSDEYYAAQSEDCILKENLLLQTFCMDIYISHPHVHIVHYCTIINAPKNFTKASYYLASALLQGTLMCLQYFPVVIGCLSMHLVSKWSNWKIPRTNQDEEWYCYMHPSITEHFLDTLALEFQIEFEKLPPIIKNKFTTIENSCKLDSMKQLPCVVPEHEENHNLNMGNCESDPSPLLLQSNNPNNEDEQVSSDILGEDEDLQKQTLKRKTAPSQSTVEHGANRSEDSEMVNIDGDEDFKTKIPRPN